jgi:agmatinase
MINESNGRIKTFYDWKLREDQYMGMSWTTICNQIIAELPSHVYISFDIDGLDPKLCPNTGTPVAGGLELQQAFYLLSKLVDSGKTIIGFDLCEVTPGQDEWDGNVGARVLYKLCNLMWKSRNR